MSNSGVKFEIHLIQNFAPSNLNRDDTGQPKNAYFGGFRRARMSSQTAKRSTRLGDPMAQLLERQGAVRTRQIIVEIAKGIEGKEPTQKTIDTVASVFEAGGLERPSKKGGGAKKSPDHLLISAEESGEDTGEENEEAKNTTKILLFLDKQALPKLIEVFKDCWGELSKGKKDIKEKALDKVGRILFEAVKAPDIALFGRMLEVKNSTPFGKFNMQVQAACQVAHPISTHKVDMEMDFFTAVDDLNPHNQTGAGMMGVVGFNSACYYRYALVDRDQLARNLSQKTLRNNGAWAQKLDDNDYQTADAVVKAFFEAMVYAIPAGKQTSFAAQNLPSFGLFVRRQGGVPLSLANAFAKPVRPTETDDDLVGLSVERLTKHWDALNKVYGTLGVQATACFHIQQEGNLNSLEDSDKHCVINAIEAVMNLEKKK